MSIKNVPSENLPAFGRRLRELADEKNIGTPALLAKALYENCKDLVEPSQRRNKHGKIVKDLKHDIDAIKRMVQRHFNEENAYNVQSKFLYAYSRLFNCSLDYLFGVVPIKSCDLAVRDICMKLHISEDAVVNLMNEYDSDPEVFSCTRCWSDVLSSEMFSEIPMAWLQYCMDRLAQRDLEKKIDAIRKAEDYSEDTFYKTAMMEPRLDSLKKLQAYTRNCCDGSYSNLSFILAEYIKSETKKWVESQHKDLRDNYFDNEIKKIRTLESALKEGAKPVKNNGLQT